jgi:hypothetical protein
MKNAKTASHGKCKWILPSDMNERKLDKAPILSQKTET